MKIESIHVYKSIVWKPKKYLCVFWLDFFGTTLDIIEICSCFNNDDAVRFLKYIWPFFTIMDWKINKIKTLYVIKIFRKVVTWSKRLYWEPFFIHFLKLKFKDSLSCSQIKSRLSMYLKKIIGFFQKITNFSKEWLWKEQNKELKTFYQSQIC